MYPSVFSHLGHRILGRKQWRTAPNESGIVREQIFQNAATDFSQCTVDIGTNIDWGH